MNLPELPPRHVWACEGLQIRAQNTMWNNTTHRRGQEEIVYHWDREKVHIWRINPGRWEPHTNTQDADEAHAVMAALCWLGEADYTLRPEEGETGPTTPE